MDNRFAIIVFFLLVSVLSKGQNSVYVGAHSGLDLDQYNVVTPNEFIGKTPISSFSGGLIFGYSLSENFALESGFVYKRYNKGYGLYTGLSRFGNYKSKSRGISSVQIPIVLAGVVKNSSEKWGLVSRLGFYWNSIIDKGTTDSDFSVFENPNEVMYFFEDYVQVTNSNFGLIETGIGLAWYHVKNTEIGFNVSYFSGLKTLGYYDIGYQLTDEPLKQVTVTNQGNYFSWQLSAKVHINRIFQKKST